MFTSIWNSIKTGARWIEGALKNRTVKTILLYGGCYYAKSQGIDIPPAVPEVILMGGTLGANDKLRDIRPVDQGIIPAITKTIMERFLSKGK